MQQRYYDPAVGRFISPDPIGVAGGLNLYGYAASDPVNVVDPTGLDPYTDHFGRIIIGHWLGGRGDVMIDDVSSPEWGRYMRNNATLTGDVRASLGDVAGGARREAPGTSVPFFRQESVEIGTNTRNHGLIEDRDGYTLLNGSNWNVGDLMMIGYATKRRDGGIELKGVCVFNDIVDPLTNADRFLAFLGKVMSFGRAKNYVIRIAWSFDAIYYPPKVGAVTPDNRTTGWPFK